MEELFYEFCLVDPTADFMTLAVALKNQNILITNVGKQVFSNTHRNEHNRIT